MRILLVEDHEDSAKVLRILFETRGYQVLVAGTVALALQTATHSPYDLLISDIRLPDGTGHDLLRILSFDKSVTAIAISAFGTPQDIEASLNAGFKAHLKKPIDVKLLLETMEKLIPNKAKVRAN